MNDEFLYALRRDPPAQFAHRLKRKLQAQESQSRKRFFSLKPRTMLLLLAGPAVAGGWLMFGKQSAEESQSVQPRIAAESNAAESERHVPNGPAVVPQGRGADPSYVEYSEQTFIASADNAASPPSERASTTARDPQAISPGETSSSRGLIRAPSPELMIAASPVAEPLIRNFLDTVAARSSIKLPKPQVMEADAAFASLCAPRSENQFGIVVTSRRMTRAELATCRRNNVADVQESKLGYQALVLTSGRGSTPIKVAPSDVYLALAKEIPNPEQPTQFIPNPNVSWDEVDRKLEPRAIALLGPAHGTPLRMLFERLILEPGCNNHRPLDALQSADPERYAELCHTVRGGRYYEVEQTASLIPQYLWAEPNALVVVDYRFYRDNQSQLAGSAMHGPEPSAATFADGSYPLARPIYLYADPVRLSRVTEGFSALRALQLSHTSGRRSFAFVPLDEQEARAQRSRSANLSESDLINDRSEPR